MPEDDSIKKNETGSERVCPSCGTRGLTIFHRISNVPVESNLMMNSLDEALAFPRADIVLALCEQCGFITNIAYDTSSVSYAAGYEDQQGFSPTFNAFAKSMADRLIEKHDLRNKDVVEVGCGKGDFLALICELGNNRGVGIDPAALKERVGGGAAGRLTFINENYSEEHSKYSADIVVCRHTLEHIYSTAEFLQTIRRTIGSRLDTLVFIEVPDVTRILQESAFWDIYYEHCSYFSPGSLARLFRSCGFGIIDLSQAYDNQYLLIEAKPINASNDRVFEIEESSDKMVRDVERFTSEVNRKLDDWKDKIQRFREHGKRIVIWGSGSKCVAFIASLGIEDVIEFIVDINPYRHGKFIPGIGKEIVSPEKLKAYRPDVVIIMNSIYYDEISRMLLDMDLRPEIISV